MNDESAAPERRIVVLGVGNLLWADEGFGVRCVEALDAGWDLPPDVGLMDGGTLGLALVPLLLDTTHVLLFDAVAHRGEPGTLIVARDDEIPALMGGNKMSLHQVGMNDILASLELLNHKPAHFTVVGIKPVELADYGGSLTERVQAQIPAALQLGIDELRRWGVEVRERAGHSERDVVIGALRQERYESGRPAPELACRSGDERFLAIRAAAEERGNEKAGGNQRMSGVIDALAAHPSCDVLRKAELDDWLARNPRALLFFIGDRPEGLDVTVVVRELATSYGGRLRVGLIDQRDEAALMTRFGVVVMPAVVYMRDGQPTELVARMRDWPVFSQAADRLLEDAVPAPLNGGNA